jgi:DNA-binding winged helix-turn-helix (wHTH) protein
MNDTVRPDVLRFGVFEVDPRAEELRKNGLRVPLQGQPFQVCTLLLEHAGELVTREELRQRVWPEDTFVDFEQALNTAIAKIRLALGDEADNPRFVETLPRRGYRFVAPVTILTADGGPIVAATDWIRALPDMVSRWLPAQYVSLGTDGFGLSDTRAALRRHFKVDAASITVRTLGELARRGEVKRESVREAIDRYDLGNVNAAPAVEAAGGAE